MTGMGTGGAVRPAELRGEEVCFINDIGTSMGVVWKKKKTSHKGCWRNQLLWPKKINLGSHSLKYRFIPNGSKS